MKRDKKKQFTLGIAWYRPEQWDMLRMFAEDKDVLEETHDEWVIGANRALRDLQSQGITARRVDVDVHRLMVWCQQRGVRNNAQSRTEYVTTRMREDDEANSSKKKS